VLNLSGVAVQNSDYDAYGNTLQPDETPITIWLSSDGYFDIETGHFYQIARYIDRETGTWRSLDEITLSPGELDDANLFSFVGGNPVNGNDPSGHLTVGEATFTLGYLALLGSLGLTKYVTSISGSYKVSPMPAGPDITTHLRGIRSDLERQYQSMSVSEQRAVAMDIFNYGHSATNWEIKALATLGMDHQTVTVSGKAYVADEVNYWLYGCWLSIVGVPKIYGQTTTYLHRKFQTTLDQPGSGIDGRLAWYNAGYDNDLTKAESSMVGNPPSSQGWTTTMEYYVSTPPNRILHKEGDPYK
jgi:RHS repeat-associated protein